jgi:GTP pyrophosphokinase
MALAHPLSGRFDAALLFAHRVHHDQARKGTQVPYVAHVLGVAGIVLEYGGTEPQAIGGLLHDSIEDAPLELGATGVRRIIADQFGADVLRIVEACTDTDVQPKPDWIARKRAYLEHLPDAPEEAVLVSAADKLHNVRAIRRDFRAVGELLWLRFNPDAAKPGILGYYRALVGVFNAMWPHPIVADLDREMTSLEAEVGDSYSWPPRKDASAPIM